MRLVPSLIAVGSLIGGFAIAQSTGSRPAGGAVLAVGGAAAGYLWWQEAGPVPTVANTGIYLAAFAGSHPLAKQIGAWPSVLAVSAATGVATYAITSVAAGKRTAA